MGSRVDGSALQQQRDQQRSTPTGQIDRPGHFPAISLRGDRADQLPCSSLATRRALALGVDNHAIVLGLASIAPRP